MSRRTFLPPEILKEYIPGNTVVDAGYLSSSAENGSTRQDHPDGTVDISMSEL